MSDGFDKEAEREKLREKLAEDDEKREHTQRMSELLLKGATMTNRHCDDCGDPIFRQDGREFCPSCHTVDAADVDGDSGATADGTPADTGTADGTAAPGGPPDPGSQSRPDIRNAGSRSQPQPAAADSASRRDLGDTDANGTPPDSRDPAQRASGEPQRAPSSSRSPTEPDPVSPGESSATGGVADARESLTRTLTRFARAAESADDPRRAREHLRAAREAAEAIAALD